MIMKNLNQFLIKFSKHKNKIVSCLPVGSIIIYFNINASTVTKLEMSTTNSLLIDAT